MARNGNVVDFLACYTCHPSSWCSLTHLQPLAAMRILPSISGGVANGMELPIKHEAWKHWFTNHCSVTISESDDKSNGSKVGQVPFWNNQKHVTIQHLVGFYHYSRSFLMRTGPLSRCLGILSVSSCLGSKVHTCTSGCGRKHWFTIELR